MQYRQVGRGSRKEKLTLGETPAHALAQGRLWREQCRALSSRSWPVAGSRQEAERVVSSLESSPRSRIILMNVDYRQLSMGRQLERNLFCHLRDSSDASLNRW
jgi:hypothetical protein